MRKIRLSHWLYLLFSSLSITGCEMGEIKSGANLLPADGKIQTAQTEEIYKRVKQFPNGSEFAIALIDGDSVYYYGTIRHQDTLRYIDNAHSNFEIGSITKVFTATLLAQEVINEQFSLREPLQSFVDFPLYEKTPIPIGSLVNHTSGLPRIPPGMFWHSIWHPKNPYKNYTEDKLEDYLQHTIKISDPPGTHYRYSNLGAGLLGYLLCRKEHKTFEELIQARILKPLGMRESSTLREKVLHLVKGRNAKGDTTANWDLASLQGAGALLSSPSDLVKFVQAEFDERNQAMALTQKATFEMDKNTSIGMGWHIKKVRDGQTWHWHNGGTGGYSSCIAMDVPLQKGVIVLSNVSAGHKKREQVDKLCFNLLKTLY